MTYDETNILTTQSINSPVFQESDPDPEDVYNPEVDVAAIRELDHILLMDMDGYTVHQLADSLGNKPGITLCFKSSHETEQAGNNYHIWNLSVLPRLEILESMVYCKNDDSHIRAGLKRGYWRIRIGPKERNGGDTYKDPPELTTIWVNPSDRPQSLPHWRVARAMFDIPELPPEYGFEWTGLTLTTDQYYTITDNLQERWSTDG